MEDNICYVFVSHTRDTMTPLIAWHTTTNELFFVYVLYVFNFEIYFKMFMYRIIDNKHNSNSHTY